MLKMIERVFSSDGSVKYAFNNVGGNKFESIYFRLPPWNGNPYKIYHMCISSQAGCAMGCKFCATAYGGFFNDLTPEDMMDEIELVRNDLIQNDLESENTEFNIVLMGMGEPLMNYENVINFCYKAREKFAFLNKIAISTVGLSNRIDELAELPLSLKMKLFISVHSPYNNERVQIMPITKKYPIESVIDACIKFAKNTNTLVKATYLLLKDINDTEKHAKDFAKLLDPRYFEAQIQLYNITPGIPYQRVSDEIGYKFRDIVAAESGVDTIIQISKGRDVDGGCGQLIKKINENTSRRVLKGTNAQI
jgi:23S rRNA (adenine2503-C2)-methyltransferase